eukprot:g15610.t1
MWRTYPLQRRNHFSPKHKLAKSVARQNEKAAAYLASTPSNRRHFEAKARLALGLVQPTPTLASLAASS